MKKSKIFLAAGSFILAISAVLATKANKKFINFPATAYYHSGTSYLTLFKLSTNDAFATTGTSGHAAQMSGSATKTLFWYKNSGLNQGYHTLFNHAF